MRSLKNGRQCATASHQESDFLELYIRRLTLRTLILGTLILEL